MEKLRLFLVVSVFGLLAAACGGGGSSTSTSTETPSQPVTLSLSELSATVEISTTHQFSATVENADDTAVDWQVNKVTGGSSTVGTISDSGLYTAPDHVPSPETVTITAVAHADATQEASATVTVMSNVTVAVSPGDTTIPAGETLQLTAAIENAKDTAASWKVNEVAGGNATLGTISSGLYTAPALPPPGGSVTITAISLADTSKTDSVNVTVQFSNASLNGPYVFSASGNDADGPFYTVGRLIADGQGNIPSAIQDYRQAGMSSQKFFTAKYSVSPDGQMSITVEGQEMSRFQLTSEGEGPMIQFNESGTGSGRFYKQDSDAFSNASMKGSYVMQFLGSESSGTTVAGVGILTCDGTGNLTGMQDVNTGQQLLTKMSISGNYSVDASGRAVVTTVAGTETSETAMYLISSDRAVGVPLGAGSGGGSVLVEKQQITSFSNASLSGNFVLFDMRADPTISGNFTVGIVTVDGAGTISGVSDHRDGGTLVSQNQPFAGTYSIPPGDHGRGTLDMGGIFYVVSEKKVFSIGTDKATAGQMVAQEGAPFTTSSLQDTYVLSLRGFNLSSLGEVDKLGTLILNGNGSLSGSYVANIGGLLVTNPALTGTYSVGENGRGQATISDGTREWTFTIYAAGASHVYLLETDSNAVSFGSMESQYPAQQEAPEASIF